jgi:hypothetical protein
MVKWFAFFALPAALLLGSAPAQATPAFANRTLLSCDACHSVGTQLNAFGKTFSQSGFAIPKLTPKGDAPVAIRGQFAYGSEPDATGLPKTILDEVDFLSSAPIGKNLSYGSEVYLLDGGRIGSARQGWLEYRSSTNNAVPIRIKAGLLVLPIPVDPEEFRETNAHYALFDQTVGANPFTFFDPHTALSVSLGKETRGTSLTMLAVQPHDLQSALPSGGMDRMLHLEHAAPAYVLSAYRYDGNRALPGGNDRFWRQGYGASLYRGHLWIDAVMQTGSDSNADGSAEPIGSSGGFLQARYQIGKGGFGIVRYDGVNDTTGNFGRSTTIGLGKRFGAFRIEFEDQISHQPQTHNALGIVFGFGLSTVRVGSQSY